MSFSFSAESQAHFKSKPLQPAAKVGGVAVKKPNLSGLTRDIESGTIPVLGVKQEKSKKSPMTEKLEKAMSNKGGGASSVDLVKKRPEKTDKKKKLSKDSRGGRLSKNNSTDGSSFDMASLKKYGLAAAIIIILAIPVTLNLEIIEVLWPASVGDYNSDSPSVPIFASPDGAADVISSKVVGAEKDEVTGSMKVTKNCVIFYSDDPGQNENVITTRVCPDLHDVDLVFSTKGIYGTHPNAEKSTLVSYVVSGGSVWLTFFDQHNSTKQAYTIPPSQELPLSHVFGPSANTLPPLFDAVKIVHSMYFLQRTSGLQPSYPNCVSFYASLSPVHNTRGVMACQSNKKKTQQVIDLELLRQLSLVDHRGDMIELAYIVPGSRASVKVEFAPDPEGVDHLPVSQIELTQGRSSKVSGNPIYDADEHQGEEWKLRPKLITITYAEVPGRDRGQTTRSAVTKDNEPTISHEENE